MALLSTAPADSPLDHDAGKLGRECGCASGRVGTRFARHTRTLNVVCCSDKKNRCARLLLASMTSSKVENEHARKNSLYWLDYNVACSEVTGQASVCRVYQHVNTHASVYASLSPAGRAYGRRVRARLREACVCAWIILVNTHTCNHTINVQSYTRRARPRQPRAHRVPRRELSRTGGT